MSVIVFDFESRSEADLLKVGAWQYSCHPSTDILCFAYFYEGQKFVWCNPYTTPYPVDLQKNLEAMYVLHKAILDGVPLEAHNAFFERCMWQNVLVPKHGKYHPDMPMLPTNLVWQCTAARAAIMTLPRTLDKVAKVLNLKEKKDLAGSAVMKQLCKPLSTGAVSVWDATPEKYKILFDYCLQDVSTEVEVSKALPHLSEFEERVYQLDQRMNMRGITIDKRLLRACIQHLNIYLSEAEKRLSKLTGRFIDTSKQAKKMQQWFKLYGIEVDDLDKETVTALLLRTDLAPEVREVLELRSFYGRSAVSKYESLYKLLDPRDDKVRDYLIYAGAARTGRWAGKLIQPQNFPRPTPGLHIDEAFIEQVITAPAGGIPCPEGFHPMDVLTTLLRSMFIASPGAQMFGADYSSIEPRVLFWLAEEETGLKAYRGSGKVYEEMAAYIFLKPMEGVTKTERQLGKQAVLGCGYQMGAPRFRETCAGYGIDISEDLAKKAVHSYRQLYSKVVDLWYGCERAFKSAMANPNVDYFVNRIRFRANRFMVKIQLPSGRELMYYTPRMVQKKDDPENTKLVYFGVHPKTKQWAEIDIYGGKIVEHITQAVSRDILAHAMLNLEENGYDTLLTVHDEPISECLLGYGSVEHYVSIMCDLPEWADGLPMAAEGWEGLRYG